MEKDELKALIEANLELTKENHQILKKIRGVQTRTTLFTTAKWVFLIVVAFGSYYYISPFFSKLSGLYSSIPNLGNINAKSISDTVSSFENKTNVVKSVIPTAKTATTTKN